MTATESNEKLEIRLRAEFPQTTTSELLIELKRDTVSDHVSTREIAARLILSGLRTNAEFGLTRAGTNFYDFLVEHAQGKVMHSGLHTRQQNWLSVAIAKTITRYRLEEGTFGSSVSKRRSS
jgi:hypothetical protein